MNYCYTLLLFVILLSYTISLNLNAIVEEIAAGTEKSYIINSSSIYIISVTNLSQHFAKVPPRFHVECFNCDTLNPALITLRQERGVTSLQLPLVYLTNKEKVIFNYTERTLCPFDSYTSKNDIISGKSPSNITYYDMDNSLIVSLSTANKGNMTISLKVTEVADFILELDVNKTITLTPSGPVFYFYEFSNDPNEVSVVIKAESELGDCMFMSIKNKSCLLFEEKPLFHNGYFQTVTYLGAIVVNRDEFPLGFYVVFSLSADDNDCSLEMLSSGERSKTFVLSLSKTASVKYYVHVVLGTLLVILIFCIFMLALVYFCFMRKDVVVPNLETYLPTESYESCASATVQGTDDVTTPCQRILSPAAQDALSIKTDSSLDETDIDVLMDAEEDKNVLRTKRTLCLSDLAKKNPSVLKKKSGLYMWNLTTVAIFYGLPACQLVLTYHNDLKQSGNIDLCYYNFLCSHTFGYLYDFNHIFSNVGYIVLGLLFLIITYRKQTTHNVLLAQNRILDRHFGVPQHFGLFYAMGTSLIIEGVLSACYHICPNIYNFQLDVSFMYIISTLCMVKIYQSRHPDVNATAYSTFFLISLVLFLNLWGLFSKSDLFWVTTNVLHSGIIFYLSLHIYYVGTFKFDLKTFARHLKEFQFRSCLSIHFWRPMYLTRFILLAVINVSNWALDFVSLFMDVKDFSSYILIIFIANLVLYTSFYIIMKIVSGEKILLQPFIYIVLTVLSWSAALYYFYHKTITWKETPAKSRMYNKPCELFDFYDSHDIWHFLSSAGLFFSFLVLLTLDDDLIFVDRCKIPVF